MTAARPLVVLGGAGDLTARLLLPSLAHLVASGVDTVRLIAVADRDLDDTRYRDWVSAQLARHDPDTPAGTHDTVAAAAVFIRGDVTDPQTLQAALRHTDGEPPIIYLALPNAVFADTLTALERAGVPEGTIIAVEKPFGSDGADARRLNDLLHRLVPESATFRIDHFLAKRTVLNILGLRFANRLFEPVWNNQHVDRVEIVYDETLGLEGRAGYYDTAGALRDMLQNHLLQILALIVMEPPHALDSASLGAAKAEALRAVRTLRGPDAVRARYLGYAEEDGVEPDRGTETFVDAVVHVDSWRWAGVPFRLRTGKALGRVRKEVCVHFRPVPHSPFTGPFPEPNTLHLDLDTDAMALELDVNGENDPFDVERRRFSTDPAPPPVPAYATVLAALLAGDTTLSITDEEAEQSWRIVSDLLADWDDEHGRIDEYAPGSDGPSSPPGWP